MAGELYAAEPVVRDVLDEAAEMLAGDGGVDLRRVLYPVGDPVADLERTAWAQPALFAVEVALARLWRSWGVVPDAMLGHSLGEYSAACVAGVFSFADGLRLVAARGRLLDELPAGDMIAVAASADDLAPALAGEPELALAAVNAPRSVTVSGPAEAVARLAGRLAGEGVRARPLATSHAFHSAMMDPAVERFRAVAAEVELHPPEIPFVSNSTGAWIEAAQATDPAYWARHLRSTVRFADGLGVLLGAEGARHALVEVGPGHALTSLARRHPRRKAAVAMVPSLAAPGGEGDLEPLLAALGRLWTAGVEPDWQGVYRGQRRRRVPLPGYPFERRRHWLDGVDLTFAAGSEVEPEPAPEPEAEREPAAGGTASSAADGGNPRGDLERAVAGVWSDLLGVERVGRNDDFFDLGGSSLAGLQLAERLARELDVALPGSFLLEASTVAAIAELIAARGQASGEEKAPSCLVRLQRGSGRPLFLVHQVGGHVFTFRDLARGLGPPNLSRPRPVNGLRALGLEPGERPLTSMAEMAGHYLALVRAEQPRGPYLLGGASMGGMVAFDMARRLTEAGEEVALLALMDTPCGDQMPPREGAAEAVMATLGARAGTALDRDGLAAAGSAAGACRIAQVDAAFDRALERLDGAAGIDLDEARRHARVLAANVDVLYDYRPEPWPGELLFFRAAERRPGDPPRPELPWIELARGGTEVVIAPGDHQTMHQPPHVETVAARLRRALARSRRT
jgi:thioesterase domain-containing protein/malonyl CoA-acyl carrier protein transacylase